MIEPTEQPEARVVVLGENAENGDALFIGSLEDAIDFVHTLPADQQREVAIFTEGRIYDPREV